MADPPIAHSSSPALGLVGDRVVRRARETRTADGLPALTPADPLRVITLELANCGGAEQR